MTDRPLWLAHAAPNERAALARDVVDLELGVGKAAAAATLAAALARGAPPAALLLYGTGGALGRLAIGSVCLVGADRLADDGRDDGTRFVGLDELGFGPCRFPMDPARTRRAAELLGAPIVAGATVSACSASDAAAARIRARGDAEVESMEGAAVALVCARFDVPMVQLRAIANRAGDGYAAGADFAGAARAAAAAVQRLLERGWT